MTDDPGDDRVVDVVPAPMHGERLDRLVALVSGASRAEASRWVAEGRVTVDGAVVVSRSQRVTEGAVVAMPVHRATAVVVPEPDPSVPVCVVHEDDEVLVVDKAAGQVVHPGAGNEHGTLVNGLLARYPELRALALEAQAAGDAESACRPGIVQRLDQGTTGLLMVGRTRDAVDALVAQLTDRTVERRYVTLVWGRMETSNGLVDAPVGRSFGDPTRMAVTASGRPARTRYEVQQLFAHPEAASLLECRLETGRTHQIRVHLAAIGHPVVGDARYGGARPSVLMGDRSLDRPFLHAAVLGFVHPTTRETMRFTSPLPDDLVRLLARFE